MADNAPATSLSVMDAVKQASLLDAPPPEAEQVVDEAAQSDEEILESEVPETEETEGEEPEVDEDEDTLEVDEEETDEDEEDQQPEMFTVKVDGEEIEVTLDEALSGYQRQSAFTKGMQKNAEDRKAIESEKLEMQKERSAYQQGLQRVHQFLQSQTAEPDWDSLRLELPADEYARRYTDHQRNKETQRQIEAENERLNKQALKEQEDAMRNHMSQQAEVMKELIPAWRTDEPRNAEREKVIKYAKDVLNFTQEEIAQASDARAIRMLYDSWQLSQIKDQGKIAKKRVRKAPKAAKAGTPKGKGEVRSRKVQAERQRFDNNRSIKGAVDYLLNTSS